MLLLTRGEGIMWQMELFLWDFSHPCLKIWRDLCPYYKCLFNQMKLYKSVSLYCCCLTLKIFILSIIFISTCCHIMLRLGGVTDSAPRKTSCCELNCEHMVEAGAVVSYHLFFFLQTLQYVRKVCQILK